MKFKDRESAERVQSWLLERVSKKHFLNSRECDADGTSA